MSLRVIAKSFVILNLIQDLKRFRVKPRMTRNTVALGEGLWTSTAFVFAGFLGKTVKFSNLGYNMKLKG